MCIGFVNKGNHLSHIIYIIYTYTHIYMYMCVCVFNGYSLSHEFKISQVKVLIPIRSKITSLREVPLNPSMLL